MCKLAKTHFTRSKQGMKHSRRFASLTLMTGGLLAFHGCAGTEPSDIDAPDPGVAVLQVSQQSLASESEPLRNYQGPGWTRWDEDQRERHSSRPLPDTLS